MNELKQRHCDNCAWQVDMAGNEGCLRGVEGIHGYPKGLTAILYDAQDDLSEGDTYGPHELDCETPLMTICREWNPSTHPFRREAIRQWHGTANYEMMVNNFMEWYVGSIAEIDAEAMA